MTTTVASVNLRFTLPGPAFDAGLRKVLAGHPDIVALQEAGKDRDHIIERVAKDEGYAWARPDSPNGDPTMPVMWKITRYGSAPRSVTAVKLAGPEFVGHLPGRKDRLPASIATEVCLDDLMRRHPDGAVTVVLNYHLTAEIQDVRGGGGYKRDPAHLLRVLRHRREKRRLGARARGQKRRDREVYAAGDGNYAGMQLGGFTSCWQDRKGGTLGGRAVDICFADRKPSSLKTIETASDHDALICTYGGN